MFCLTIKIEIIKKKKKKKKKEKKKGQFFPKKWLIWFSRKIYFPALFWSITVCLIIIIDRLLHEYNLIWIPHI